MSLFSAQILRGKFVRAYDLLWEDSLFELVLGLGLGVAIHEDVLLNRVTMHVAEEEYVTTLKGLFHH